MSIYEMMQYDELLQRAGIQPGEVWHCGDNPAPEVPYDGSGTYDGSSTYSGSGQSGSQFCLTGDINVNGLLLNHRDDNGTVWLCTNIEGWWGLPPNEIPDVPQPYWDGSLLTTGRYLPRTITISGTFIPPNKSWVWYNRDVLMRVAGIVRGAGLITLCGNESPDNHRLASGVDDQGNKYQYLNPLYTPPKMAIIQMADTPLVETVNASGLTQFSLSFKCVQPNKLSIYENNAGLVVPDGTATYERHYEAFSQEAPGDPVTTEYAELTQVAGETYARQYQDVQWATLSALIPDEELTMSGPPPHPIYSYYNVTDSSSSTFGTTLRNGGDYFAFPIFVFGGIGGTNPKTQNVVTIQNVTTQETMSIVKDVPDGSQLVVDTGLRRVAVVKPTVSPDGWIWNDRSTLSLVSQWVSLAPGNNLFICSKGPLIKMSRQPQVYWRDTWMG
jgi:hypothetical protein